MPKLDPPNEDQNIPLGEACEIVFGGRCGVATLKSEARKGRLKLYKIGRRYYTTLKAVREMVNQGRLLPKEVSAAAAEPAPSEIAPPAPSPDLGEVENALHKVWSNVNLYSK